MISNSRPALQPDGKPISLLSSRDFITQLLVDISGDRSTHRLVGLDTLLVDYQGIG